MIDLKEKDFIENVNYILEINNLNNKPYKEDIIKILLFAKKGLQLQEEEKFIKNERFLKSSISAFFRGLLFCEEPRLYNYYCESIWNFIINYRYYFTDIGVKEVIYILTAYKKKAIHLKPLEELEYIYLGGLSTNKTLKELKKAPLVEPKYKKRLSIFIDNFENVLNNKEYIKNVFIRDIKTIDNKLTKNNILTLAIYQVANIIIKNSLILKDSEMELIAEYEDYIKYNSTIKKTKYINFKSPRIKPYLSKAIDIIENTFKDIDKVAKNKRLKSLKEILIIFEINIKSKFSKSKIFNAPLLTR